ncbi:nucleotidyltransferase domain-containing protein [Cyanobacterium aponinum UTEX 3222]|uniref:type VII toxin-antitoxin system MntA family adenylyltransferase antitoxin n=1 Tax=Cyanobacterium aponinum TaxID=379064 RepID=UPI00308D34F7|nr:nucleotidyltransferase domain-containing protein [Cyanobacterium aponinum UTEX 3222]
MNTQIYIEHLQLLSRQIRKKIPYIKMLVLFGSRARGEIHDKSDWNFAVFYDEKKRKKYSKNKSFSYFEVSSILENLFQINAPIDVVDLNNCSSRIADRVATEGILIYEIEEELFNNFKEKSLLSDEQKKL